MLTENRVKTSTAINHNLTVHEARSKRWRKTGEWRGRTWGMGGVFFRQGHWGILPRSMSRGLNALAYRTTVHTPTIAIIERSTHGPVSPRGDTVFSYAEVCHPRERSCRAELDYRLFTDGATERSQESVFLYSGSLSKRRAAEPSNLRCHRLFTKRSPNDNHLHVFEQHDRPQGTRKRQRNRVFEGVA